MLSVRPRTSGRSTSSISSWLEQESTSSVSWESQLADLLGAAFGIPVGQGGFELLFGHEW